MEVERKLPKKKLPLPKNNFTFFIMERNHKGSAKKGMFMVSLFLFPALLCLGFYFFVIRKPLTENKVAIYLTLPHFGSGSLAQNRIDSLYESVTPDGLIDSEGTPVNTESMQGKIYVAHFFCADKRNDYLKTGALLLKVQKELSYLKTFFVLSQSICSSRDTLNLLREYVREVHANSKKWIIARSANDSISTFANQVLRIENTPDSMFTRQLFLIDKKGNVRGIYDGTYLMDVDRLIVEAKVLSTEK